MIKTDYIKTDNLDQFNRSLENWLNDRYELLMIQVVNGDYIAIMKKESAE